MSTFHQSYQQAHEQKGVAFKGNEEFQKEFPNLYSLLTGIDGDGAGQASGAKDKGFPPATLMLFVEGGAMKWCASPKSGPRVAFGTIPEPLKGFWSIEDELAAGHFEWKVRRG